ncbi:MAG: transglycosylase SLT domain-containing protein [Gammaproteobacteria bacterium]|nr:transglycosylase SLT domain-containing protein [Gammaproteobacteria bacterium]
MQCFKKHILFGVAALISVGVAHASIIVIGSPTLKVDQLSKQQIDAIYLGKNLSVGDGEKVQPLDQPADSIAYQQFYKSIVGWDAGQISSYWSSQVFSGQGAAPVQVDSDAQAIATIASNPDAIAYIESNSLALLGGRVKVLYGDFNGSGSGTNYYPPGVSQVSTSVTSHVSAPAKTDLIALQKRQQRNLQHHVLPNTVHNVTFTNTQQQNVWNVLRANLRMPNDVSNPEVQQQLLWYLSHRGVLKMFFENAKPYLGYIVTQLSERHMPAEIALLPMIESGYNPLAYSKAGAAGLWQMMPGTASSYGLDINWWYDSRSDILTSTHAALNYLQRLDKNLGGWELALAAYDAGQGAVQAAIEYNQRTDHNTSFWDLPLPNETRNYVPKLLALAEIIRNPDKYHVTLPYIPNQSYFSSITLNSQLDLAEISHLAEVPVSLVHSLNPGLRRWATSPDTNYNLLLPTNKVAVFQKNLQKVLGHTHISWQYHEVRSGETLAKIAHNYNTKVDLIEKVNDLKKTYVPENTGLLVPLYLNHTYTLPIALNNQLNDSAFSYNAAKDITANDLLSSKPSQSNSVTSAPAKASMLPNNTASKPQTTNQKDSLKSLLTKIYGSD